MADVKIRFAVNPDAETEKLGDIYVDNVDKVSNTSFAVEDEGKYQEQPTGAINGVEALSWAKGYLVFNADGYLANEDTQGGVLTGEQEPQEFVWGATDGNGYYEVKVSFRNATNLDAVVFYGDTVANQFPTMAFLDNSTYPLYSDDARWAIKFSEPSAEHSIRFVQWNRPNYNAVLTKIAVMPAYVEIDKYSGLKSVESLSQSTGQPKEIFYGVVPSSGSVEVVDVGGEIEDMVRDGVIPVSNMPVEILVNDNLVQTHISQDSDYSLQSKLLSIQLSNIFEQWDKLQYQGRSLTESTTLYQMLKDVLLEFKYSEDEIDDMLDGEIYYGNDNSYDTVKSYIESITVPYPFIEKGTLRQAIDNICRIAQLSLIQNDNGKIKFVSSRPIYNVGDNIIHLPKRCQDSIPDKDVILKNKILNANINLYDYELQTGTLVSSDNIEMSSDTGDVNYVNSIPKSIYENAYNIQEKNPYYLNTIVERAIILEPMYNADMELIYKEREYDFYKTHLSFDISDYAVKDLNNLDIVINGETHGYYTVPSSYEGGTVGSILSRDYKSQRITISKKIIDATSTIQAVVFISNLVLTKRTISFDIFIPKERTFKSEAWLNATVSIFGVHYKKQLIAEYQDAIIDSDLVQKDALYKNSQSIQNLLAQNLNEDYRLGINTATLSVACLNYYDTNGTLVKDWSKGEILQVGDIVQVDKDNNGTSAITYGSGEPMRFRITGRTFRKVGVPMLDLELQEVRLVQV